MTYCPICRSGLVARRTVDGETTAFGVSGLLFRENFVLYDGAMGSRWRVETGRAVDEPLEGTRLRRANAHPLLFWFAWLDFHPGTSVWGRD